MTNDVWQLRIATYTKQAAIIESLLWEIGALAVTLIDGDDNPIFEPELGTTPLWRNTHVLALFAQDFNKEDITAALNKLNLQFEFTFIKEQNWERAWLNDFKPMQFGKNLWIVPSAYSAPNDKAVNLYLDPGLAFGTGTHPSTALCLNWLDANASYLRDKSIIDYGCGSGVLAIASLLLGAKNAVGIDIDIQALEATRSNANNNNILEKRLPLYLEVSSNDSYIPKLITATNAINGNYDPLASIKPADVVVANILANPLINLAPFLAKLVKPSGYLVLAGILQEQANKVINSYQPYSTDKITIIKKDDWVCLSLQINGN